MMGSDVTTEGVRGVRPGREATTGVVAGRPERPRATSQPTVAEVGSAVAPSFGADGSSRGGGRGERRRRRDERVVPEAEFRSYYGQPVLNPPVWHEPDIPGYLFLGGLAGASSVLAAGAQVTGRRGLERTAKVASTGAIGLSLAALIHDLGRPSRFLNMLRVCKPTSPMSIGSWLLASYTPASVVATATAVSGRFPRIGVLATVGSAALGPAVASYTAALVANTAVPAWHDGWREMPFVFVSSGAAAAAGMALAGAPVAETAPARRLAVVAVAVDVALTKRMERRMGLVAETYHEGSAGRLMKAAQVLNLAGAAAAAGAGGHRWAARAAGVALVAASACTRFGIFRAGMASARDPKYTVVPQRERLEAAAASGATSAG
jgi:formate-dependent nitrite reductase membrane component NrfD